MNLTPSKRKRTWAFKSAAMVLAGVVSLAVPRGSPAADVPAPASLSATWKGVYFIYPNLMGLELALGSTADGAVTGTLKYAPAVDIRSALGQPKHGSYQVAGRYEEASRSLLLKPGEWIEKPELAGATGPLAGVVDPKGIQIAGVFEFPNMPVAVLFVLAREAGGDTLVAEIKKSGYPAPLSRAQQEASLEDKRRESMERTFAQLRASKQPGVEEQIERMRRQLEEGDKQQLAMQERALEQLKALPRQPALDEQIKQMEDAVEAKKNRMKAATNPAGAAAPSAWAPPALDRVEAWASLLKTEAPKLDLQGSPMEKIYPVAYNLFDDDCFKKYFGITYESMDTPQRKAVVTVFTQNGAKLQAVSYLARPFGNVGDFGAPDVTLSIYWQRVARAWLAELRLRFARMPADLNSFDHLSFAEAAGKGEAALLWPRERETFNAALAETRARLASPVLAIRADQLIASAAGLDGARALAGWSVREKEILKYASPDDQQAVQARIDVRLDHVLSPLVDADFAAFGTRGRGLDALVAGNQWYSKLSKTYEFAKTRPPILAALQKFQSARAGDVNAAAQALIAQIDTAKKEAGVRSVLSEYLACPGDDASAATVQVRQHAEKRIAAIQHEEMLALFSNYEKSLMSPPESGRLDLTRADPKHIPQPDELRLALLRGFAFGTGKILSPNSAKISTLLGGGSMIVTLSDTDKGRYVQTETGSWLVLYTIEMRFSLPDHDPLWDADPNLRKGAQLACDATNAAAALLHEEDNIQEFRLYSDGWGVPNLRQEGAGRAGLDALLKGMMKKQ